MSVAPRITQSALSEYYAETQCNWCEGCGNYGIWTAVKYALTDLNLHPWQVCLCYDVGCHGTVRISSKAIAFMGCTVASFRLQQVRSWRIRASLSSHLVGMVELSRRGSGT